MVCALNKRSLNGSPYSAEASAMVQSFRSEEAMEDDFPSRAISAWLAAGVMMSPDSGFAARNSSPSGTKSSAAAIAKPSQCCFRSYCKPVQPGRIVYQDLASQLV